MKKFTAVLGVLFVSTLIFTGCGSSKEEASYVATECVTLPNYKGVEVDCTVTDKEVQSELDTLVTSKTTTKKVSVAKDGDVVNIDFVGKVNGKAFSGGTATAQDLTLGSGQFIKGFESGLVGAKKGDSKTLNLKFPTTYSTKDLAGKAVVFTVKVNSVSRSVKPVVNDAFIKKNSTFKTLAEYKAGTKKKLAQTKKDAAGTTAFSKVLEGTKVVTLPAVVVSESALLVDSQTKATAKQYNVDFDTFLTQYGMTKADYQKQLISMAKQQAKSTLVIEAIAMKEKLSVTAAELKTKIAEMVKNMGAANETAMRKTVKDSYYIDDLDSYMKKAMLKEKVDAVLKKNAVIKE